MLSLAPVGDKSGAIPLVLRTWQDDHISQGWGFIDADFFAREVDGMTIDRSIKIANGID